MCERRQTSLSYFTFDTVTFVFNFSSYCSGNTGTGFLVARPSRRITGLRQKPIYDSGWCGLFVALGLRLRGTLGSTGISGNPGSRAEAGGTEVVQTAAGMESCRWVTYVNKWIYEVSVLCKQMRTVVTKYICEVRDVFCFLGL